jgi:hypothetical protein
MLFLNLLLISIFYNVELFEVLEQYKKNIQITFFFTRKYANNISQCVEYFSKLQLTTKVQTDQQNRGL